MIALQNTANFARPLHCLTITLFAMLNGCSPLSKTNHFSKEAYQKHVNDSICAVSRSYVRKNFSQQLKVWNPSAVEHRIVSTSDMLFYDKDKISPIIINPKDGMQDLPDSVWSGFCIGPIKERAKADFDLLKLEQSFVYIAQDASPYAYAKAILRSLTDAGFRWVYIPTSNSSYFPIEMINNKEATYVVHSGDSTGFNSILQIHPDSMLLYVNSKGLNGNLVAAIETKRRDSFEDSELEKFETALIDGISQRNYLQWIGIDPHPSVSFKKLVQICRSLEKINNSHRLKIGINATLYGVYTPWGDG